MKTDTSPDSHTPPCAFIIIKHIAVLLFCGAMVSIVQGAATVDVYPFLDPSGPAVDPLLASDDLSSDYTVTVDNGVTVKTVEVYQARTHDAPGGDWTLLPSAGSDWPSYFYGGNYSFASFDSNFAGDVTVQITSNIGNFNNVDIRPLSSGITGTVSGGGSNILTYTLSASTGSKQLSIERAGKNAPLLLFANPIEVDPLVSDPGDPDIIYFGPGIHEPVGNIVQLRDNQTLYLAGGAILRAGVHAYGNNIKIRGRGIIDHNYTYTQKFLNDFRGNNIIIDGITIRGGTHSVMRFEECKDIIVRNVKVCNGRMHWDDCVHFTNSQRVLVEDCFFRADDASFAIECYDPTLYGGPVGESASLPPCQDIIYKDCTVWCDRGLNVWDGWANGTFSRNIKFINIDFIHTGPYSGNDGPFVFGAGNEMGLYDFVVDKIRVNYFDGLGNDSNDFFLRMLAADLNYPSNPGNIYNFIFRDIEISGPGSPAAGDFKIDIRGYDATHQVSNVTFDNLSINGSTLNGSESNVTVGPFAGATFSPDMGNTAPWVPSYPVSFEGAMAGKDYMTTLELNPEFYIYDSDGDAIALSKVGSSPAWLTLQQNSPGEAATLSGRPSDFYENNYSTITIGVYDGTTNPIVTFDIEIYVDPWSIETDLGEAIAKVAYSQILDPADYFEDPQGLVSVSLGAGTPLWINLDQTGGAGAFVTLSGMPSNTNIGVNTITIIADDDAGGPNPDMTIDLQLNVVEGGFTWKMEYPGDNPHTVGLWHMDDSEKAITTAGEYGKMILFGGASIDSGSPQFGTTSLFIDEDISGTPDNEGDDLDSRARVALSGSPILSDGSSFTVECWVKFPLGIIGDFQYDETHGSMILVDKSAANEGFRLFLTYKDALLFSLGDGVNSYDIESFPVWQVDDGQWHHVAGTWNADSFIGRIFFDGIEIVSESIPGLIFKDNTRDLTFGNYYNGGESLIGSLDEVRISDVAYKYYIPQPDDVLWAYDPIVKTILEGDSFSFDLDPQKYVYDPQLQDISLSLAGPAWLSLDQSGGAGSIATLSGNPDMGGMHSFTITASDSEIIPNTATVSLKINVQSLYEQWVINVFSDPDGPNTDPADDFDNDGMTNEDEYLTGTDPEDPGNINKVQTITIKDPVDEKEYLYISVGYWDLTGKFFYLEASDDLNTWTTEEIYPMPSTTQFEFVFNVQNSDDNSYRSWYKFNTALDDDPDGKQFMRLKVTGP